LCSFNKPLRNALSLSRNSSIHHLSYREKT
jgi:hypothetical protein